MAVMSKFLDDEFALPYNCYELGHTWTASCTEAATDLALRVNKESFKMYAALYLATQLLLARRYNFSAFASTFKSIIRSTSFLSLNAFFTLSMFCASRHLTGRLYLQLLGHIPAAISSYFALLIERPGRRSALAFYCANIAAETVIFGKLNQRQNMLQVASRWAQMSESQQCMYSPRDQATFRTLLSDSTIGVKNLNKELVYAVANGEVNQPVSETIKQSALIKILSLVGDQFIVFLPNSLRKSITFESFAELSMFAFGICMIMHIHQNRKVLLNSECDCSLSDQNKIICSSCEYKKKARRRQDLICLAIGYFIGDFGPVINQKALVHKTKHGKITSAITFINKIINIPHCTTSQCWSSSTWVNCAKSSLSGAIKGFSIGLAAKTLFDLAMKLKYSLSGRLDFRSTMFWEARNFRLAMQLALFSGIFKATSCTLHKIQGAFHHWQPAVAAAIAALIPRAFGSRWIAGADLNFTQYVFWKALENFLWQTVDAREARKNEILRKFNNRLCEFAKQISADPLKMQQLSANLLMGEEEQKIRKRSLRSSILMEGITEDTKQNNSVFVGGKIIELENYELTKKLVEPFEIKCENGRWPAWVTDTLDRLATKQLRKETGYSMFDLFSPDNWVRILYSLSVAQLFYVAVLDPTRLRASYMRFLNRMTHNRLQMLNRNIIDHFGVLSSAGTPLYKPLLQWEETSAKFQEGILLWML